MSRIKTLQSPFTVLQKYTLNDTFDFFWFRNESKCTHEYTMICTGPNRITAVQQYAGGAKYSDQSGAGGISAITGL